MSKVIEEKIVEMRFDNKHFEQHTKESMSTLDKLKQKLQFKDASKGLESINTSANKIDMKGLSGAIETVRSKFSALEIIGITALANITNSAVNAGKRMVNALAIEPIKDGFNEYEMTLNAVQTTMAATGKTSKEVEERLKDLDEYADKTVYSTADMLNNLPKFTNAGVELESATKAMIGIANATALAGGDAGKASIAFYNLGQAIGTGYLTRMDYNSINNAGIATMEWKNQMVEAAIAAGTLTKVGEDQYKAGNKTLTLQQLFIDGLQEQWATTDVMMKVFGDYGNEQTAIGKKAYAAAQDIKTFSQMMESLKATAGTGWKDTWQNIFGGLEEAKQFWTGLTNFISNILTGMADYRNKILESAMGKSFKGVLDNVKKPFEQIEQTVSKIKDYTTVVDEIINGKWGNGQARWDALTQAGYDWAHAQNLVNEKLGVSLRRATSYQEAQEGIAKTQEQSNLATANSIIKLLTYGDAQLRAKGYTDEQIASLRELEKVSKKTGIPLRDFIENIDKIDGRFLFVNSFKNIGKVMIDLGKAIKQAWNDIFNPGLNDEQIIQKRANGLFNIIAAVHKLTTKLPKLYDENNKLTETGDKIIRTFKGVFAIFQLITSIVGGGFKLALTIIKNVLGAFNLDLLDFTAMLGDAAVKVRNWLKENVALGEIIKAISTAIAVVVESIIKWIRNNEALQNGIKKIKDDLKGMGEALSNWTKGLKETDNIPKYIAQGLIKGIGATIKLVVAVMIELGKALIEAICDVLQIHSPSKAFFEIGRNIVTGLAQGIADGIGIVFNALKLVGKQLIEIIKSIDFGDVFGVGIAIGVFSLAKRVIAIFDALTKPFIGFGDLMTGASKMIEKFGDGFKNMCDGIGKGAKDIGKGVKRNGTAKVIKSIALAIGVLAASLYVISKIDSDKLWGSVGAIAALAAILGVLALATSKIKDPKQFRKSGTAMIILAISIGIMASALKKISKIEPERMASTVAGLAAAVIALVGLAYAINLIPPITLKSVASITFLSLIIAGLATVIKMMSIFDNGNCLNSAKALSLLLLAMSGALLILSIIPGTAFAGIGAIALLTLVVSGLAGILTLMNLIDTEGAMTSSKALSVLLLSMSGALVILGIVGALGPAAFIGIAALATLIAALTAVILGIGYLMEKVPALEQFLDSGISVLIKIAGGLGEMMGAFVKGALTQISGVLPVIGTNLSLFMSNVEPFIDGARTVDGSVLAGVGYLSGAILALTGANLISGITSLLPFVGSFARLGAELSKFMFNALPFLVMSKSVDPAIMQGIKSLAEAILMLTGANLLEQVTRFMGGESSLAKFGSQLGGLATNLNEFVNNLGTFDESKIATVTCACSAIKALAEAAKEIPNEGGLWGALCGENSLAAFGDQLPGLATHLNGFISNLGTFDESKIPIVNCACDAIKALAKAAKEIPNEGGLWGALCGENSLAKFADVLPGLGTHLSGFISNLGTFDESKLTTVTCAGKAIKALADAAGKLPKEDGLWQKIVGQNGLSSFAGKLPDLGTNIKEFISNLGTLTPEQVTAVNSACKAIKTIASLGNIDIKDTGKGLVTFGSNMVTLGSKVKTFVSEISGVASDNIDSAIKKTKDLLEMAKTVANADVDSLSTFGESLKKVAKDGANGFIKQFSGSTPKSEAKQAVKDLLDAVIKGAESKKSSVEKTFKSIAQAAVDKLCTKELKSDAASAGKDLIQGLINGLKNKDKRAQVYDAAFSLGQLAVQGEKDGQQSNSPSKATEQAGEWLGEGLVIGIQNMGRRVYSAGKSMGQNATNSISNALNTAMNLLDSDMDTQPTIRPVLDLSDVESGAGYLNSIFGNTSLGVSSNINAISRGMSQRNQNGANHELVSAIDGLRKDLSSVGGTTNNYNVNGVTYDDGSNITDAVRTLVRAATMERRV